MTRAVLALLPLVLFLPPHNLVEDPPPAPPQPPPAARVVAAVTKASMENCLLPEERMLRDDALGDRLVRAAAAAAGEDPKAFLVGLAHAVDPAGTLARHPLTAAEFRGLETPEERLARRKVLGKPTLRGRTDLLVHFACAAAVAAVATPEAAEAGSRAKEVADSKPGGSGFSFADLLADLAGIRFAAWVAAEPKARLARLAKEFRGADFGPDPAGQPEGLTAEAFGKEYGSLSDERFRRKVEALKGLVDGLDAYGKAKTGNGEK